MKTKTYIFWIKSNHGTDIQHAVILPAVEKKSAIKDRLENWCSQFGAWTHSDNTVEYGYVKVNKGNLNKLGKYNDAKIARGKQIELLTNKSITTKDFSDWLTKNKKKLKFPFQ